MEHQELYATSTARSAPLLQLQFVATDMLMQEKNAILETRMVSWVVAAINTARSAPYRYVVTGMLTQARK
jgi:hypothetical protein